MLQILNLQSTCGCNLYMAVCYRQYSRQENHIYCRLQCENYFYIQTFILQDQIGNPDNDDYVFEITTLAVPVARTNEEKVTADDERQYGILLLLYI